MIDYSDHKIVLEELKKSQNADHDMRQAAREAKLFLTKRDGQWEPFWWEQQLGQPRYTFDMTTNVVNQIAGKMKQADFAGDVKPIGGEASKEVALTLDGIVRNIQSISNATDTYNKSSRSMVTGGIDGWEIVQKFVDGDSFDQDLIIENVENFVDRVWFDVTAEKQDMSDANFGFKFTGFSPEEYKKKWPKGSGEGLSDEKINNAYFHRPDLIMVGTFYYIKEEERELVMMSNNRVYVVDDDYKKVADELLELGISEVRRRKRKGRVVYSRLMDSSGWLAKEEVTVFEYVPLVPIYGNFEIIENKVVYFGAVEKRIDAQRVLNYSLSREIGEGALAPRAKYWMTEKQVAGHTDTLATLNTNSDPVQLYTPDPDNPMPPQQSGGAAINPGLTNISQTMVGMIPQSAGLFAPSLGDNPNAQSGVAIERLQDKGDIGTIDYFESREIATCHTMRILIKAIPKVYLGERQTRILKEDGSFDMVNLGETIVDGDTGEDVLLNDLAMGSYDVVCSSGPSFQNRQQETVSAMVEIGQVVPGAAELGADITVKNIGAPGMTMLAERIRAELFKGGKIPEDQWTDEEKEEVEKAQAEAEGQPPQPDAQMVAAESMMQEAQAAAMKVELDGVALQLRASELESKIQQSEFKILQDAKQQQLDEYEQIADIVNKKIDSVAKLKEILGADGVVTPAVLAAFEGQIGRVIDAQESTQ